MKHETKPKPAGGAIPSSNSTNVKNTKNMKLFKNPNNQTNFDSKSGIPSFIADYNNEITKYHLMKNKNYILCATRTKLILYNVMKFRKIAEFSISLISSNPNSNVSSNNSSNFTFEKMIEILNKYDTVTLKSWFSVDIKLGVLSITFTQENIFNNPFNFDVEFLEKVLDRTNSFTKQVNIDFKFVNDISISLMNTPQINRTMNSRLSDISTKTDSSKFSNTYSASAKKGKSVSNLEKNSSCGYILFKMIYSNYVNKMLEKYSVFFDEYFWDTRDNLKNELARMESGKFINNNLFNVSSSSGSVTNISTTSFFLFSTYENFIVVAPYYEDITYKFKLPSFLKDIVHVVGKNYLKLLLFILILSNLTLFLAQFQYYPSSSN